MPTQRPRHQLTETDEVAAALDRAGRQWPGEPRSRLLLRLVQAGDEAIEQRVHAADQRRRTSIQASSGAFTDAFGPDFLTDLRDDWPA